MLDSPLLAAQQLSRIAAFTIDGIHTEQAGSKNQDWDRKVADTVASCYQQSVLPAPGQHEWYAVQLRWFAKSTHYRRDLDNLRLKPILDSLTRIGFWPDDHIQYVRAIYSEAVTIAPDEGERVEVAIYGAAAG